MANSHTKTSNASNANGSIQIQTSNASSRFQLQIATYTYTYNILNKASHLIAIISLLWYTKLVATGDYFQWALPLLAASCICKLFSTNNSSTGMMLWDNNNLQEANGKQQQQQQQQGSSSSYYQSLKSNHHRGKGGQRINIINNTIILPFTTFHQRIKSSFIIQKFESIYSTCARKLTNDNHSNLLFLSSTIVILPCFIYFTSKLYGHFSDFQKHNQPVNHTKYANDFGKLASAALSFLLLPVSKHSSLLSSSSSNGGSGALLQLSEVHMIRLHIAAGCVVLFGGVMHGLYYTLIWIKLKEYTVEDVFPNGACLHGVLLFQREYYDTTDESSCYDKVINLLGIICGISLSILGIASLYWVRRTYYRVFYILHIGLSIVLMFGLVCHYNKMIWYMAPSLLIYLASNVPVYVESWYKWWKSKGCGVRVTKVVCIPESGGCVELSFCLNEGGGHVNGVVEGIVTEDEDLGDEHDVNGNHSQPRRETDNHIQNDASTFTSIHDTIGKYIKLHIPEISAQSHPFTIFSNPSIPNETIHVLFRPCGSFTTALSNRLRSLTLLPEPTPSEIENHQHMFQNQHRNAGVMSLFHQSSSWEKTCPPMLINGIRTGTGDAMFEAAMNKHDRVLIIAGGVGIVSYISLIHALRQQALMMMMVASSSSGSNSQQSTHGMNDEDGANIIDNHRRAMNFGDSFDGEDLEGGFTHEDDEDESGNNALRGKNNENSSDNGSSMKRIEVHWMSRDEGLIRHVVQNYLEPFCHDESGGSISHPISINIVIHHTSPHAPSSLSDSTVPISPSGNNIEIDGPTTWEPDRDQQHLNHHLFALPTSTFEGNKTSLSQNLIPSLTFGSIVFGGLWIIKYCYNNLQDKHVVETRLIAVVGTIVLSIAISVLSNGVVVMGDAFYSKLFAYSKLESRVGSSENIVTSEMEEVGIEVPDMQEQSHTTDAEDIVHTNPDGKSANNSGLRPESNPEPQSIVGNRPNRQQESIMNIRHCQGRPDLSAIVRDLMSVDEDQHQHLTLDDHDENIMTSGIIDAGIFMCGPKSMSSSVRDAIKQEEERDIGGLCSEYHSASGRKRMAVWQEVFEL